MIETTVTVHVDVNGSGYTFRLCSQSETPADMETHRSTLHEQVRQGVEESITRAYGSHVACEYEAADPGRVA